MITDSDHHMYFDNPEEFAAKILEDLSNLHELDNRIEEPNHHYNEVRNV